MRKCGKCGKEAVFPFTCAYCGKHFCDEHRLPESHDCSNKPKEPPPYISLPTRAPEDKAPIVGLCPKCHFAQGDMTDYDAETMTFKCRICGLKYSQLKTFPHDYVAPTPKKTKRFPSEEKEIEESNKNQSMESGGKFHFIRKGARSESRAHDEVEFANNKRDWLHFEKGKAWEEKQKRSRRRNNILSILAFSAFIIILCIILLNSAIFKNAILPNFFPKTYSHVELVEYALVLINSDRHNSNLDNVTLSNTQCAQQHADDMLRNNYFSHWDLQGFKPYMRYTLSGGNGSVAENCAAQLGSYSDLKETLEQLEWNMIYDDASSNWGHKYNILNPFHNKVGIGIAYGNNNVYLVQDFEDDYVAWSMLTCSHNQVTMRGTLTRVGITILQVAIYFDKPTNLTVQQLAKTPYDDGYNQGTYVGLALPSGWQATEGITITASTWSQTGQAFAVVFNISPAFTQHGNGVYTLYLTTSSESFLTTYSIWN